jgi:hypothetical protein
MAVNDAFVAILGRFYFEQTCVYCMPKFEVDPRWLILKQNKDESDFIFRD